MADKFAWTKVCMQDFWKNMVQVLDCFRLRSDVCELEGCISELYYAMVPSFRVTGPSQFDGSTTESDSVMEYEQVPVFFLMHNLHPTGSQVTWEYYMNGTNLTLLAAVAAVASLEVC